MKKPIDKIVIEYVQKHPWCRFVDIITRCGFSYAQVIEAQAALNRLIKKREIREIGQGQQMGLRKLGVYHRRTGTPAYVAMKRILDGNEPQLAKYSRSALRRLMQPVIPIR